MGEIGNFINLLGLLKFCKRNRLKETETSSELLQRGNRVSYVHVFSYLSLNLKKQIFIVKLFQIHRKHLKRNHHITHFMKPIKTYAKRLRYFLGWSQVCKKKNVF